MDEVNSPKKRNLLLRLLAFLITLVLVVGAVFLVANRDRLNVDALKRWITYLSLARSDTGQAESFSYSGSSTDIFALLEDDLLVCSAGGVHLYSQGGVCYVDISAALPQPVAEVQGDTAAVWSPGGDTVILLRDRTELGVLDELEGKLLSVRLNSSGWLAVLTRSDSYNKAVVTVYDRKLTKLMDFYLSTAFATDAVVSQDCKSLAVVFAGQENMSFQSSVILYSLEIDPQNMSFETAGQGVSYDLASLGSWSLGNNVILELQEDEALWFLGDTGVSVLTEDGLSSWSCAGRYLKGYAFGDRFAALLVSKHQAGSQSDLITVDRQGQPSASLSIHEQVLSLSAAGKYVAVLTAGRLRIYTQSLDLYDTLEDLQGVQQVLMRPDGTALLIAGESARLYIPG